MARGGSKRPLVLLNGKDYHLSIWIFPDMLGGYISVYHKSGNELDYLAELSDPNVEELPFLAIDWLIENGVKPHEIKFHIPDAD